MRIYFDFLCWGLRKLSFGAPEWVGGKLRRYQNGLVYEFWLTVCFTALCGIMLALVVLITCAMLETTKQQMLDAMQYSAWSLALFMFVNWLIGWFHEFIEEREDLIRRLKR